jgi:hypothetical protein
MPRRPKNTKVVHRNLGKEKAWGIAHIGENKIELDSSLNGHRYVLYMLHEHYHIRHPEWSETMVIKESRATAKLLRQNNIRWCDL